MQSNPVHTIGHEEEEFTFRALLRSWRKNLVGVLRYWRLIAVAVLLGALLGVAYAYVKKNTYTARLSFMVEESKSGGGGAGSIASALAGQVGLDIGGLAGGSGLLAGDNVLELLKSRSFSKKALLTPYGDSASTYSLADQYATIYGWKEKWSKDSDIGKVVSFPANQAKFPRLEDSLLQVIVKRLIDKGELSIGKPDKKLGLFELEVTTRDERFSQLFCERILKIATDFYVDTKTRRISNNVARLQRRADSLGMLLDRRTYSAVAADKLLLDANPAYSASTVNAEISTRNQLIQATIYSEVIKNLEVSRTALVQETPTVQVVDRPELPLQKNKTRWLMTMLAGMFIAGGLSIALLMLTQTNEKRS